MTRKVNYLNNRDILKEIHKSKNSYCSYSTPNDAHYDIIIKNVSDINAKSLAEAKKSRSDRLAREAQDVELAAGNKRKLDEFVTPVEEIADQEVVFRVMTWEHIPVDDTKKKKDKVVEEDELFETEYDEPAPKTPTKYVRVNFPPFKHYKLDANNQPVCVGISHWQGDIDNGHFSKDHGQMTNKLAHMFIKLCERYSTRGNWRGYTYNDEMRSQALLQLSQVGLQFDESKSQNPFAYYTATLTNSFTRVLNTEKRNQNIRDDILEMNNYNPSYTRQGEWGGGGWGADD